MSEQAAGTAPLSTDEQIAERAALALSSMPYARQLGVCLDGHCRDRGIRLRLPFQQRLVGNTHLSSFHGGVTGSFMQITAVVAAFAQLGALQPPRFIDFSIDYLNQAGPRDLHASCIFHRIGRRVAAVGIACWQSDESKPVALARAHLLVAAHSVNAPTRPRISMDAAKAAE